MYKKQKITNKIESSINHIGNWIESHAEVNRLMDLKRLSVKEAYSQTNEKLMQNSIKMRSIKRSNLEKANIRKS